MVFRLACSKNQPTVQGASAPNHPQRTSNPHQGSLSCPFTGFQQERHRQMAVGQNQRYHYGVGEFTTHFRTYFSGWIQSDVHWGHDLDFVPWPNGSVQENLDLLGSCIFANRFTRPGAKIDSRPQRQFIRLWGCCFFLF